MAGHSKFKNIQHRKGAQDQKRAKLFTKITKEIAIAIKAGSSDPEFNSKLRSALAAARAVNLPKDRVTNIIQQANNNDDQHNYSEVRYEGFTAGGIAIICEVLTDNRNRTASEVRSSLTKSGGNLGETNSVSFLFDHLGIIFYDINARDKDQIMDLAIAAGAEDVEFQDEEAVIYTKPHEFGQVLEALSDSLGNSTNAYIGWRPKNHTMITDLELARKIEKLIDTLENNDDVQQVFSNHLLAPELLEHFDE